jgi:SOS-response transcriptional repressor LexA
MSEAKIEAVYEFIKAYTAETGQPPSQRQIIKGCRMSKDTVLTALSFLEARGKIARVGGVHRAIKLLG